MQQREKTVDRLEDAEQRFVADTMLGEVARWLRIMGYDVLYSRNYTDKQLLGIASKTGRVLLTRDRGLYNRARKRGAKAVYVSTVGIVNRLAEIAYKTGILLKAEPSRSRCPECNSPLVVVRDKEKLRGRVPPGALNTYDVFYVCPRCGRVYWEGGHWRNIRRVLDEARKLLEGAGSARD